MNRILLVIATAVAVLAFEVSAGDAAYIGNAPWCAVVNIGAGDVEWDCEYPSVQACSSARSSGTPFGAIAARPICRRQTAVRQCL
jgi:hypothetical protein